MADEHPGERIAAARATLLKACELYNSAARTLGTANALHRGSSDTPTIDQAATLMRQTEDHVCSTALSFAMAHLAYAQEMEVEGRIEPPARRDLHVGDHVRLDGRPGTVERVTVNGTVEVQIDLDARGPLVVSIDSCRLERL